MRLRLTVELSLPEAPGPSVGLDAGALAALVSSAVTAEGAGFDGVWLGAPGRPVPDPAPTPADPVVLAAAVATVTSSLALGVMTVMPGDRHPAVLARDLTTVDVLSGGRVVLRMGPGRSGDTDRPTGPTGDTDRPTGPTGDSGPGGSVAIPERTVGRALGEALEICRSVLSGEERTMEGRWYRIAGPTNRPSPVRPGGPPILLGPLGPPGVEVGRGVVPDGWVVEGRPTAWFPGAGEAEATRLLWRGELGTDGKDRSGPRARPGGRDPLGDRRVAELVSSASEALAAGAAGVVVAGPPGRAWRREDLERLARALGPLVPTRSPVASD